MLFYYCLDLYSNRIWWLAWGCEQGDQNILLRFSNLERCLRFRLQKAYKFTYDAMNVTNSIVWGHLDIAFIHVDMRYCHSWDFPGTFKTLKNFWFTKVVTVKLDFLDKLGSNIVHMHIYYCLEFTWNLVQRSLVGGWPEAFFHCGLHSISAVFNSIRYSPSRISSVFHVL